MMQAIRCGVLQPQMALSHRRRLRPTMFLVHRLATLPKRDNRQRLQFLPSLRHLHSPQLPHRRHRPPLRIEKYR